MEPQLYLEFTNNIAVAKAEEWFGREYARDWLAYSLSTDGKTAWQGQPYSSNWIVTLNNPHYPVPPDTWNGAGDPPPEAFTWYYMRAMLLTPTGGVIVLDDEILRFATQEQTLSDDSLFSINFDEEALTLEELSPEAQALVTPPPNPFG